MGLLYKQCTSFTHVSEQAQICTCLSRQQNHSLAEMVPKLLCPLRVALKDEGRKANEKEAKKKLSRSSLLYTVSLDPPPPSSLHAPVQPVPVWV